MPGPDPESGRAGGARGLLARALDARPGELAPLLWSFAYYFCLLCGYYILRPIRDEMGIQGGVANLQWVFTATFVVMLLAVPLFGWAAARFPRRRLVPIVYWFFILHLALFYALFRSGLAEAWVARAFFVWVSVFNLFVVSVFWSLMADVFSNAQARRLFGVIAAGGSAGAIVGPGLTALLSQVVGTTHLLPISMAFLLLAVGCVHALLRWSGRRGGEAGEAVHGGILAGATHVLRSPYLLGIALFMILYTTLSTFLYFEQAHIVEAAFAHSRDRTTLFAGIDLAVNALTVGMQLFLTARVVAALGVPLTLMLVPALLAAGFLALGLWPVLAVLVVFQVVRRAGNYAVARPVRELLYTVIPREDKYKAKNFNDTVVYRGGDAASGWAFAALSGLGLGLGAIAFIAVPVAVLWALTGLALGRRQERLRARQAGAENGGGALARAG